jgi:hypothetical protein
MATSLDANAYDDALCLKVMQTKFVLFAGVLIRFVASWQSDAECCVRYSTNIAVGSGNVATVASFA